MRKSVPFMDFGSVSGEALKRANLTFLPIGNSSFFSGRWYATLDTSWHLQLT